MQDRSVIEDWYSKRLFDPIKKLLSSEDITRAPALKVKKGISSKSLTAGSPLHDKWKRDPGTLEGAMWKFDQATGLRQGNPEREAYKKALIARLASTKQTDDGFYATINGNQVKIKDLTTFVPPPTIKKEAKRVADIAKSPTRGLPTKDDVAAIGKANESVMATVSGILKDIYGQEGSVIATGTADIMGGIGGLASGFPLEAARAGAVAVSADATPKDRALAIGETYLNFGAPGAGKAIKAGVKGAKKLLARTAPEGVEAVLSELKFTPKADPNYFSGEAPNLLELGAAPKVVTEAPVTAQNVKPGVKPDVPASQATKVTGDGFEVSGPHDTNHNPFGAGVVSTTRKWYVKSPDGDVAGITQTGGGKIRKGLHPAQGPYEASTTVPTGYEVRIEHSPEKFYGTTKFSEYTKTFDTLDEAIAHAKEKLPALKLQQQPPGNVARHRGSEGVSVQRGPVNPMGVENASSGGRRYRVTNAESLPRGTGAKFVIGVESPDGTVLVAKRWARNADGKLKPGEVLADLNGNRVASKSAPKSADVPTSKPVETPVEAPQPAKVEEPVVAQRETPVRAPEGGKTVGLANRAQAMDSALADIEPTKGRSAQDWQDVGRKKVEGGANPNTLADDVASGRAELTGENVGVLLEGDRLLAKEVNDAAKALDDAINSGDASLIADRQKTFDEAVAKRQDYVEKVQVGKGRWSDVGRALQAGTDLDTGNFADVLQAATRRKGAPLSGKEQDLLRKLVDQLSPDNPDGALGALNKLNEQLAKERVKTVTPKGKRFDAKVLDDELESLNKEFRQLMGRASSGIPPEMAAVLGKIAVNYAKRGINTIDEIVAQTIAWAKGHGVDVSRQDVIDAMAEPTRVAPTKSDLQKQIENLKREAKRESTEGQAKAAAAQAKKDEAARIRQIKYLDKEAERLDAAAAKQQNERLAKSQREEAENFRKQRRDLDRETQRLDDAAAKQQNKPFKDQSERLGKIADLENQLKTGNYRVPTKQELKLSREAELAKNRIQELQKQIRGNVRDANLSGLQRAAREGAALPRALQATLDASATLRQGLLLAAGHPVTAAKAFGKATKAMFNPAFAGQLEREIMSRPMYLEGKKAGLYLAEKNAAMSNKEEAFMSNLAEKVPGYGKLVAGSERHYNTYLNVLRSEVFDTAMLANPSPEGAKALANFINVATGRGRLGKFEQAGNDLANAFFAPRFAASRIQAPLDALALTKSGKEIWRDPVARKELVRSWASLAASSATVIGLAKASGADVEADPASPDWGKIKVGDTRLDIFGGMQQPVRQFAKAINEAQKYIRTGTPAKQNALADITRFVMYKVSPIVGTASTIISGRNVIGQEQKWDETLIKTVVPLVAQDLYELFQNPKTPDEIKIAAALGSALGIGIQTFEAEGGSTPKTEAEKLLDKTMKKHAPKSADDTLKKIKRKHGIG